MNVIERFLKYVTFDTASSENSTTFPSTDKQLVFADHLVDELKSVGVTDAVMDKNGYVYGHIPASDGCGNAAAVGLIAHMDTSPSVSGANVKPRIIVFDGKNAPMTDSKYIGNELIVSDGTTLLGADDKAGVAEIVSACEKITADKNLKHGKICICFTPDEEIGNGADRFDFERFGADYAYTVDGGELGGIEYENFFAAAVKLKVGGVNTHPGSAKNKMRNALIFLNEFVNMLPAEQTPAHTEGREGFYHICGMRGDETSAQLEMLVRDFERDGFEARKRFVLSVTDFLNSKYGDGTFCAEITDSYYNMREVIEKHMEIVSRAENAMRKNGVEPVISAIRGGTDGARLSFEGLPCPDISTGGMNYHSIYESVPVEALKKMTDIIVGIVSE